MACVPPLAWALETGFRADDFGLAVALLPWDLGAYNRRFRMALPDP